MKTLTRGALKKIVQEEIQRQRLQKENTVAATPGMTYNTPRFIKRKK